VGGEQKPVLLVALGGNALISKGQRGAIEEQFENLRLPMRQIAALARDYRIILTHGNGPQIGDLLLQQEACRPATPDLPLEILVAQTQGQIGFMIESTLDAEFMALGVEEPLFVTLLSYVVVDKDDPAFANPTKPIGPAFGEEEAAGLPYPTVRTAKGFRRVVASPRPLSIVEKREIRRLIDLDFLIICCGGGGIPVVREGRSFSGVDAVIDKDLASACLAREVGVDVFVIATDVAGVFLDFGQPGERLLRSLDREEASGLLKSGGLAAGSMRPKVEACLDYLAGGGYRAVICSIEEIDQAVAGVAGTQFIP